jgi:hypothetical protein
MRRMLGILLAVTALASAATVNGTTATASTDPNGWVPVPWVRHGLNPTATIGPDGNGRYNTDRVFPTVLRVDGLIPSPLGKFYMWVWRHGAYPRTANNGGRLQLFTADTLDSQWVDRGWVTPENMSPPGWGPYSWTGGDVVWSAQYSKFFSVPHAYNTANPGLLSTFLMESADGVNWTRTSDTPVLSAGPEWYDKKETGYGKLLRDPASPPGTEKWIWLYRSGYPCAACPNNQEFYSFSVARADDIHGPWTKDANNPAYAPFSNGALMGLNGFVHYEGKFQIVWQDSFGDTYLSRSSDLHTWEDWTSSGSNRVPVFTSGGGPSEAIVIGGHLLYDSVAGQWSYVYLGWDAAQLSPSAATPGHVYVNLARGVGGHP